jgi:hypothetical protein
VGLILYNLSVASRYVDYKILQKPCRVFYRQCETKAFMTVNFSGESMRGGQTMLKYAVPGLSILTIVLMAVAGSAHAQVAPNTPPASPTVAGTTVTECTANLAPGNYDAVDVPAGATCTINNGTVNVTTGGVTVGTGATFFVAAPVASLVLTSGSLDSTNANQIEVTAHIHGHVNVVGTTGSVILTDSFIGGTVSVQNSSDVGMVVSRNHIGGSVLIENNQCFNEGNCNTVAANTIGINLICMGNQPDPNDLSGGPNTVGGNKSGQCSGL